MAITIKRQFFPTNAEPASYAVIAAQADGSGNFAALVQSLLRACWAAENDIMHDYVIKECLFQSRFDGEISDQEFLLGAETFFSTLKRPLPMVFLTHLSMLWIMSFHFGAR